jgi:hypothetical protein
MQIFFQLRFTVDPSHVRMLVKGYVNQFVVGRLLIYACDEYCLLTIHCNILYKYS